MSQPLDDRLHRALDRLEPEERELITLYNMEHEPYEAIAAALGITVGQAKSRLNRVRLRLREILDES